MPAGGFRIIENAAGRSVAVIVAMAAKERVIELVDRIFGESCFRLRLNPYQADDSCAAERLMIRPEIRYDWSLNRTHPSMIHPTKKCSPLR